MGDEIVLNQNPVIGQVVRKRFAPKKEENSDLPRLIGVVGGMALGCAIGWLIGADIVLIAIMVLIFGIVGLAIGFCLGPSDKMYPIIRYYALKIPDILHFWISGIKKAFCPTRKTREYSMKPNSFFGQSARDNRPIRKTTRRHNRHDHAGLRKPPAYRR